MIDLVGAVRAEHHSQKCTTCGMALAIFYKITGRLSELATALVASYIWRNNDKPSKCCEIGTPFPEVRNLWNGTCYVLKDYGSALEASHISRS